MDACAACACSRFMCACGGEGGGACLRDALSRRTTCMLPSGLGVHAPSPIRWLHTARRLRRRTLVCVCVRRTSRCASRMRLRIWARGCGPVYVCSRGPHVYGHQSMWQDATCPEMALAGQKAAEVAEGEALPEALPACANNARSGRPAGSRSARPEGVGHAVVHDDFQLSVRLRRKSMQISVQPQGLWDKMKVTNKTALLLWGICRRRSFLECVSMAAPQIRRKVRLPWGPMRATRRRRQLPCRS